MINKTFVVFDTLGLDQTVSQVKSEHVVALDGMQIQRIAIAQNLTLDGDALAPRSRRGRRKKVTLENTRAC